MRKQIVGAVAGLAVAGAALVGGAAQAEPGKVVVCHVTASGQTLQLNVSANALQGHANHAGDTFMEAGTCGDVPPPPPPPDSSSTSTTTKVTFPQ